MKFCDLLSHTAQNFETQISRQESDFSSTQFDESPMISLDHNFKFSFQTHYAE